MTMVTRHGLSAIVLRSLVYVAVITIPLLAVFACSSEQDSPVSSTHEPDNQILSWAGRSIGDVHNEILARLIAHNRDDEAPLAPNVRFKMAVIEQAVADAGEGSALVTEVEALLDAGAVEFLATRFESGLLPLLNQGHPTQSSIVPLLESWGVARDDAASLSEAIPQVMLGRTVIADPVSPAEEVFSDVVAASSAFWSSETGTPYRKEPDDVLTIVADAIGGLAGLASFGGVGAIIGSALFSADYVIWAGSQEADISCGACH